MARRPKGSDLHRAIYDLEVANGIEPTVLNEDVAFVNNLKASPGGYAPDATWMLPSGMVMTGEEIARLP